MKETELGWNKPRLGRYSELGKPTKTMTLSVPDLSGVNAYMEQALETGYAII